MTSSRVRSVRERRALRKAKRAETRARKKAIASGVVLENRVLVNESLLAPTNSYSRPGFVRRGFYTDMAFVCKDCGKKEVWTSRQQKWWYEVAKGDMFAVAARCRPCRRKENNRKAEARKVHLEGLDP
jgi:Probable zinc-ribbon domain